ncbi:TPA: hypothetical protein RQK07_004400 [Vibrio vulnificus]|uniref:hypothetical protein n=1 Tax=Vibrio TaxID=662 RepID=UPI0005F24E47|nr:MULTISPECIES: hypothetical protein [Vibrio]ANN26466.1 hypothetical protein FORC17_1403 [Vibrio vulnificus]EGQ9308745.1 hypothetical protein [Vibrio parahaemolyticus]EGQ9353860.1 hypothetical protein [Vibrio parahaemolyticus]EGQ9517557.1 hypothetical protein [Vibrio parahaemolyticus]EIM7933037.1 hypothetical protein [Vibrio parahaemolyticus]
MSTTSNSEPVSNDNVEELTLAQQARKVLDEKNDEIERLKKIVDQRNSEAQKEYELSQQAERERRRVRNSDFIKALVIVSIFAVCLMALYFYSINNPAIFNVTEETITLISQSVNAGILLIIPLFLGSLGALARVLISGLNLMKNTMLVFSSGLMAMFSWVGIKSGILISLIAPHVQTKDLDINSLSNNTETEFYSMALVAIVVGMFSSNVYIFINQKVEAITIAQNTDKGKSGL